MSGTWRAPYLAPLASLSLAGGGEHGRTIPLADIATGCLNPEWVSGPYSAKRLLGTAQQELGQMVQRRVERKLAAVFVADVAG